MATSCSNGRAWIGYLIKQASNEDKEKSKTNKPLHTEKKTSLNVNCPLDKDELGRNTWSFLHTMAAYYPEKPTRDQQKDMQQFIKLFSKFYPCDICSEDMRNKLVKIPPKVKNQHELSLWFCQLHNEVNKTLGKPEFNCNLVNERWRDGWADGSCD